MHAASKTANHQYAVFEVSNELNRCSGYVFCATLCLRCNFFFPITVQKAPKRRALYLRQMLNRVYKASPSIYNPTPATHLASIADYSIADSAHYSKLVYASNSSPFLLRRWIGSLRISTPGPTLLESFRRLGKICKTPVRIVRQCITT